MATKQEGDFGRSDNNDVRLTLSHTTLTQLVVTTNSILVTNNGHSDFVMATKQEGDFDRSDS